MEIHWNVENFHINIQNSRLSTALTVKDKKLQNS